jgi:methyl-accepting chemotaxis protein
VAQAVQEADGRVKDTNSIFALILEIADQTKLLGLNAAILAAQAGVHGKGFTVVADEIRKLAANSESSAKKIPQILSGIRNAMGKVESSSKQTYAVSRKQSESMHEIKRVMEDIQKSVNQLVDSVGR